MATADRPGGWRSYDAVVDAYEEAAVPRFAAVARDLVDAVAPGEGGRVLDAGTGTGIAGQFAHEFFGPGGFVVGIDPSVPMLGGAAARGLTVVAGVFPVLPFPGCVFDAVVANLVLSHLADYEAGVVDGVRVLRGGGRFGCSAWAEAVPASEEHQGPEADDIAGEILASRALDATPPVPPVPSEEPLREPANLEAALRAAGLVDVDVRHRTYHWSYSVDEYLVGRDWRPGLRYMREQADPRRWEDARATAASDLRQRFGDEIRTMGHIWIAVGTKP